jgi:transcriptional regulator with XRE-family HTH domain
MSDSDPDFADSRTLGRLIYRTRQRTGTLQRILTARTGISQPNISAYELGRRQPTWPTFVQLIAAMDRRPVIEIGPAERELPLSYLLDRLDRQIMTRRGGSDGSRVQFDCGPLFVSIMLIAEPRQSVQVVHGGQAVNVAPLPDAINPWI